MTPHLTRRRALAALSALAAPPLPALAFAQDSNRASIVRFGAVADGATVNTRAIQAAIDAQAAAGGGDRKSVV